ncbi:MAG TPA: MFS transporter [Gemmatimonadaceae bacterium]|nr:MFS transporter [Gemmatimonadaceae bacterium]
MKTFASLKHRNFRLFFIGQTISNTGNWLTNVALTLLVLRITGSGFAVGVSAACQYGPILFLSPWAGAVADRSDKRRALLLTQSLEMAQSIGLAILAFLPHPPLFGLYAIAVAGGMILAFDNPLRRSFVTEMVPKEDLANAVVLYSTIVNVSRVFGPALAGLLATTLGYGWCFAIDAATYVAVLFCVIDMRTSELHREPPKPRAGGEVREGLRYLASVPTLWISFAMLAAVGTLSYNFNVTLPLFVTRSLHSSEGVFTILYSLFSVGAVASALLVANRKLVQLSHIILGAVAMGLAMLLLAAAPTVGWAVPAAILVGMGSILYMTSTTAIVQVGSRREMHGRLLALQTVFVAGTGVIGGPICGWLADAFGGRAPIILGGVVCLAAALFGYLAVRATGTV